MQFRTIEVLPISPYLGAEIGGVDLTVRLKDDQIEELNAAFAQYQVIFFRDQKLDHAGLKMLGRYFGELFVHPNSRRPEEHPEVSILHADADSIRIVGERWHTDVSCAEAPPLGSILYLHTVPEIGGDTFFATQYEAYNDLSEGMKSYLGPLTAFHDGGPRYSETNRLLGRPNPEKGFPSASHPVVRTHPVTKRKALYVNKQFTVRINETPEEESEAILKFLFEHSTKAEYQVRFHWRPHSIAFWDNRCLQHLAVWDYYPHTRSGFRITINGDRPV